MKGRKGMKWGQTSRESLLRDFNKHYNQKVFTEDEKMDLYYDNLHRFDNPDMLYNLIERGIDPTLYSKPPVKHSKPPVKHEKEIPIMDQIMRFLELK